MAWAKLDDRFHGHPKIRVAWRREPVAIGLHALALSWVAQYDEDGRVSPEFVADQLPDEDERTSAVSALVESGLWEPNGYGWMIHDYLDYNPSREQIVQRRAADSARKRKR
jgi:hypothetical protein